MDWSSATIDADCAVVIAFDPDPPASLAVTIDDGRDYIRYGMLANYVVTLANEGGGDATAATLTVSLPPQIDAASTTWVCLVAGAGASCTASGSGAPNDTQIDLPAGRSLTWMISAPVEPHAIGGSVDISVAASDADSSASASDSDTLVIYRDGLDVPYGDGTAGGGPALSGAAADCPADPAPASLDESRLHTFALPASRAQAPVDVILDARENGRLRFRVERLNLGDAPRVRLVVIDADGSERAGAWSDVTAGARLAIATAPDAHGGTVLLLEGADEPMSIALPTDVAALQIRTQGDLHGQCN